MSVYYLSPGPSSLPHPVRDRIKSEILDTFGIGVSIMEISHRSTLYADLNDETLRLARSVFEVPDTHEIMFTPFGAQQHFCLLLDHLSMPGDTVCYTDTGNWAHAAVKEAERMQRKVVLSFDGNNVGYKNLGIPSEWNIPSNAKFIHLTVNNTVEGTEYDKIPDNLSVPLVLDMTSAIAARRDIPWEKAALIYASAQKNFGIAGNSVVIVRKDTLEESRKLTAANNLGNALSYPAYFDAKSIFNTPPVFANFVANRTLQWMETMGGTATMERWSIARAKSVYNEIDGEFYKAHADVKNRSRHNFVFRTASAELDALFMEEGAKEGFLEIKGYRSIGGIRASMYNGVQEDAGLMFAEFMRAFKLRHS